MTLVALVDTNVVVSGVLAAAEDAPTARILDAMVAGTLHEDQMKVTSRVAAAKT